MQLQLAIYASIAVCGEKSKRLQFHNIVRLNCPYPLLFTISYIHAMTFCINGISGSSTYKWLINESSKYVICLSDGLGDTHWYTLCHTCIHNLYIFSEVYSRYIFTAWSYACDHQLLATSDTLCMESRIVFTQCSLPNLVGLSPLQTLKCLFDQAEKTNLYIHSHFHGSTL